MDEDDTSGRSAPTTLDDILTRFGREVRTAREARGLSREDFANRCGLSLTTVKNIECGQGQHPRFETLIRLARGLEVSLIELVSYVDPQLTDAQRATVGSANLWLASLGDPQRDLVIALIRVLALDASRASERIKAYAA